MADGIHELAFHPHLPKYMIRTVALMIKVQRTHASGTEMERNEGIEPVVVSLEDCGSTIELTPQWEMCHGFLPAAKCANHCTMTKTDTLPDRSVKR